MTRTDDQNLASALSPEQRQQLSKLITSITERIRCRTESHFEEHNDTFRESNRDQSLAQQGDTILKEPETTLSPQKYQKDKSKDDPGALIGQEDHLKAAALAFFADWQGNVQHRVEEALKVEDPKHPLDHNHQPRDSTPRNQAEPILPLSANQPPSLSDHYPPIPTHLSDLPLPERISILQLTLLLLLSLTTYPPHSRILLLFLCTSLSLPPSSLPELELATAQSLLSPQPAHAPAQSSPSSARWKVGLATLSGAALIGITGGLATPLVAAGVGGLVSTLGLGGTVVAGYLGALAGSGVVVGGIFGAYGGRVTGRMAEEYTREVEDFALLPLCTTQKNMDEDGDGSSSRSEKPNDDKPSSESDDADHRLTVTICVSGLLHTSPTDLHRPWLSLASPTSSSLLTLRFDPRTLLSLTSTITSFPTSYATTFLQGEILKRTALAPLLAATWPLSFLKFGKILDNPFSLARVRADKAGVVLADALVRKVQGNRPVRLVGFSMGGRVVVSCLRELARRREVGVVEDVVLMGAPVSSKKEAWGEWRGVVQGRVVNVYSSRDWVLGVLERVGSLGAVAGTEAVRGVDGVENLDVGDLVMGHAGWMRVVGRVLERCGWIGLDEEKVREEKEEGQKMEMEEAKAKANPDVPQNEDGKKEEGESLDEVDAWLKENSQKLPNDEAHR